GTAPRSDADCDALFASAPPALAGETGLDGGDANQRARRPVVRGTDEAGAGLYRELFDLARPGDLDEDCPRCLERARGVLGRRRAIMPQGNHIGLPLHARRYVGAPTRPSAA